MERACKPTLQSLSSSASAIINPISGDNKAARMLMFLWGHYQWAHIIYKWHKAGSFIIYKTR